MVHAYKDHAETIVHQAWAAADASYLLGNQATRHDVGSSSPAAGAREEPARGE